MDKKKNFIMTTDVETSRKLLEEGFQLIDESNGKYTFLNNAKMNFNGKEKFIFTDKLCV